MLCFLQLEKFNCIWALSFLRSVHSFSRIFMSNWRSDLGHDETAGGAKNLVALQREVMEKENGL